MPVPSTMMGFSEAVIGVLYFSAVRAENFIMGTGPTQKTCVTAFSWSRRSSGAVTTPFSP